MPNPQNPPPADPSLWARFAAAALTGLLAEPYTRDEFHGDVTSDKSYKGIASKAAKYADALSIEWAQRFLTEVK